MFESGENKFCMFIVSMQTAYVACLEIGATVQCPQLWNCPDVRAYVLVVMQSAVSRKSVNINKLKQRAGQYGGLPLFMLTYFNFVLVMPVALLSKVRTFVSNHVAYIKA